MTTNLFNHNPVPHNSTISPVESLATEISEAFTRLEQIIISDKNTSKININLYSFTTYVSLSMIL